MSVDLGELSSLDIHWSSSEDMTDVERESVQSVITSPPYWDLKDYGHDDQIGSEDQSYEEYHERLTSVWSECYDVLRPDGTMWVVVDTVMDRGDLTLLPYHIAENAEEVGFHLQDLVVWYKPTAIAGMSKRNVVNKKEYIVFLSKEPEHKINQEVDSDNGIEDPAISSENNIGNVWRHPVKRGTAGQNVLHKAPYPTSLVNRVIRLSTDPGDVVLDPFLGSGTTAYSALDLGRDCVGYELNTEFREVIKDRLSGLQQQSLSDFSKT